MLFKEQVKRIFSHDDFVRYFSNTAWLVSEQLLRMLAGLLVGVWVARYLGPEQFGIFSFVLAFCAIFAVISRMGMDDIAVKELVIFPKLFDVYLGTMFWIRTVAAIAILVAIFLIMAAANYSVTTKSFIIIVSCGLVFQSFDVVSLYYQSIVKLKIIAVCRLVQLFISTILKVCFVITEQELIFFVWITLFDAITLAVCLYAAYRIDKGRFFFNQFDFYLAKKVSFTITSFANVIILGNDIYEA